MTATDLFMMRLDPDIARVTRWAESENVLPRGDDGGYAWHAILKAAFGDLSPQPFRLVHRANRNPYLVGYAGVDEAAIRAHAALSADPAVSAAIGLETLAVKRMPQTFTAGQTLAFEVRVRPTVRQDRNGDRRRSLERDAFLVAIEKAEPRENRADIDRVQVYLEWLRTRLAAGGADLIEARLVSQKRAMIARRNRDRKLATHGNKGGGPDVTFEGTLRISDPESFMKLLARGVGRHRSFGFGMLLLKPARRR